MKGLVISSLAGLIIASFGISYADVVNVTVINDSPQSARMANEVLVISPSNNQPPKQYTVPAMFKMFSTDYKYPNPIHLSHGGSRVRCNWTSEPVGVQVINNLVLNISTDPTTKKPNCLIDWQ